MSNESTNPVVIRILIGACVVFVLGAVLIFLIGTYPAKELRVASELQKRGFRIGSMRQDYQVWRYPIAVIGENLTITEDDCRQICQLPRLLCLGFQSCDLSGLNLDEIGNCRELRNFHCYDVTPFPVDEIRKLAACPISGLILRNARLNDSDLENFAKFTKLELLYLDGNVEIADVSFEHLEKIISLRALGLIGTSVTKEGIDEFKKKRPDVEVSY